MQLQIMEDAHTQRKLDISIKHSCELSMFSYVRVDEAENLQCALQCLIDARVCVVFCITVLSNMNEVCLNPSPLSYSPTDQ